MSRTASIAKNTIVQVIGRTIGTIFGLVTLGVMTRYLGTSGYGAFTTVTSFLQFFGILVDFGLSLTTVAMLSEHEADQDKIASNIFTLRLISAAIFFLIAPAVVLLFPYTSDVKSGVSIAAASFFLIAVNQVLTSMLQTKLRMARAASAEVLGRAGLLLGALATAHWDLGLGWMLGALVLGNGLTVFWNWLLVRALMRLDWRFDWTVWKEVAHRTWPIAVSISFNLIYLMGGVIVLSLTRPQAEVGVYGAARKILDVLTVIPIMFMGLVLPLLVKARHEGFATDWSRIMQKAFDFMAVLALPLVAGTLVVGRDLMILLAGKDFAGAGPLLIILILACASVFFGSLFGHAVIAVKKQRPMIWGYALNAALAIILNILLVPRFGAPAAAWVTFITEAFIACATFFMIWRTTGFVPRFGTALRAAFAAAGMAMFVSILPDMHVLLKTGVGMLTYAALALAFRAIEPEMVKELLSRKQAAVTAPTQG
ncbi:MAG: flippase [Patescibacteria group bacterium]|jgi:O-antigen/teichoic acid export membrane protein